MSQTLNILPRYRTEVKPDWIDANNHMGVAAYHIIMNEAGWHAVEQWGFGVQYRKTTLQTSFILEMHARYLREMNLGDPVAATVRILGLDDKRLHLWYEIYNEREAYLAATGEALIISVDALTRRVIPFAPDLRGRLQSAKQKHDTLPAVAGPCVLRLDSEGVRRAELSG